ncbi:MAG TPA: isoprenylcysteine carboxylmethyltransferase family protein [Candidatus Binataceae bacterium]|nr:isoprenylcysteine carboxylmethyltransferase family protein [Candidatus Binataceae bacterium]
MRSLEAYYALVALVGIERLFELWLSRRNARRAFAHGGIESGQRHYRAMVVVHTAFLAACVGEPAFFHREFPPVLGWVALAGVIAAQGLRYSAVIALGERWNTRIIVTPAAAPITSGPYRLVRHPNYIAVALELVALPMVRGCWLTAIVFSAANFVLMRIRVPAEEAALGTKYAEAFADRRRFLPRLTGRS